MHGCFAHVVKHVVGWCACVLEYFGFDKSEDGTFSAQNKASNVHL